MRAKGKVLLLMAFASLLTRVFAAGSVTLAWDASRSTNAIGYILYWMLPDGSGKLAYDVGKATTARVDNLTPGQTYNFYATAYDANRKESGLQTR